MESSDHPLSVDFSLTPQQEQLLETVVEKIEIGAVIPIVSNSFRNDRIFAGLGSSRTGSPEEAHRTATRPLTVGELLAERWASQIGYPMGDDYELARVAQFNAVEIPDLLSAKTKYLKFIKDELLGLAEANGEPADLIGELRRRRSESTVADLVQELDYPRFPEGHKDPLRLLARLPLPVYVTTSYYDFLERALMAEEFSPRTQVCWWGQYQPIKIEPEHRPDLDFEPSPSTPLVYHLHGLEQYASSLVLSEDDYLDFLVTAAEDIQVPDQYKPVILPCVRQALTQSSLILLGYRLSDWDFRVVFRGIIKLLTPPFSKLNLVIQLSPEEQSGISDCQKARDYLKEYLRDARFDVMWCHAEDFVQMLWNKYSEGQR